ncbi:hypothetical protein QE152_g4314 [Popillia japonica]|uniref:Uncharacterized protein n=1 Tax=Popillia japonica TaxID=7064 RepID=A0AAW1N181_POPJA
MEIPLLLLNGNFDCWYCITTISFMFHQGGGGSTIHEIFFMFHQGGGGSTIHEIFRNGGNTRKLKSINDLNNALVLENATNSIKGCFY